MPYSCFSYPADGPANTPGRHSTWSAPGHLRRMPTTTSCFRYQPELPRSMPFMCFGYPPAGPPRIGNQGTTPSNLPGLREVPGSSTCFRY